jgi:hypothetical protein
MSIVAIAFGGWQVLVPLFRSVSFVERPAIVTHLVYVQNSHHHLHFNSFTAFSSFFNPFTLSFSVKCLVIAIVA